MRGARPGPGPAVRHRRTGAARGTAVGSTPPGRAGCDDAVGSDVERPYDAVLRQTGCLDGREQAVERAHRLPDLRRGRDAGLAAAFGHDQAVRAELAECLPDRVPAHLVVLDQRELTGEGVVELPGPQPPDQILLQLLPERLAAGAVEPAHGHPGCPRQSGLPNVRSSPSLNVRTFLRKEPARWCRSRLGHPSPRSLLFTTRACSAVWSGVTQRALRSARRAGPRRDRAPARSARSGRRRAGVRDRARGAGRLADPGAACRAVPAGLRLRLEEPAPTVDRHPRHRPVSPAGGSRRRVLAAR